MGYWLVRLQLRQDEEARQLEPFTKLFEWDPFPPYEVMATTVAVVGDDLYVVHPHFQDDGEPSVERVKFE